MIIALCPPQVTEAVCLGHILDWKSGRSPRVCRSTLAAEAVAADEGTDRSCFINLFLTEIFYQKPAWKGDMMLASVQCTDGKSLYDYLIAQNPSVTDKRSMVQIRSIQQALRPSQIHWIPTQLMAADGLTKIDQMLREMLRQWCNIPKVQLRESQEKQRPVKISQMRPFVCTCTHLAFTTSWHCCIPLFWAPTAHFQHGHLSQNTFTSRARHGKQFADAFRISDSPVIALEASNMLCDSFGKQQRNLRMAKLLQKWNGHEDE